VDSVPNISLSSTNPEKRFKMQHSFLVALGIGLRVSVWDKHKAKVGVMLGLELA
jgi:hypothetical protein